jgi:Ca2+-binding RTX toxin-like protein
MEGGVGNDTYLVDSSGDVVTELANAGTDTVRSSVSYTLGVNIENLVLNGTTDINGTGNSANNIIAGNSGNNTLDGGTGIDTMAGAAGDDTYLVDNPTDLVTEAVDEGIDTVRSSASYALGSNIENLILTGSGAVNATGNSLDNTITGNASNNTLDGGAGVDTMAGGGGNDTYLVDNFADHVNEGFGAGTDTILSSSSYTLGANIENLILTDTSAINATGNSLDNIIAGSTGDNILDGGAGVDILTGQGGADTFAFFNKQTFGFNTSDRITDFSGNDQILISKSAFGITATSLNCFSASGAKALTAGLATDALFVYDTSSGNLYLNQNGNAKGAGTGGIFAVLDNKFSGFGASNINLVA